MPLTYIQTFSINSLEGQIHTENPDPGKPVVGLRTAVNLELLRCGGLSSPFRDQKNGGWCPRCGRAMPAEGGCCSPGK